MAVAALYREMILGMSKTGNTRNRPRYELSIAMENIRSQIDDNTADMNWLLSAEKTKRHKINKTRDKRQRSTNYGYTELDE